ncbi:MAG: helix-turn-helix domain-containing protein [Halanaerobiales bacterium]
MILFQGKYKNLSVKAKWLYITLLYLRKRYKSNTFYRSNEDLADDSSLSLSSLKRAKRELQQTDLIKIRLIDLPAAEGYNDKITEYTIFLDT